MPEYVAPEVANGEGVSYGADMWSLGIITYILLSGISPFRGVNDRETLTRIKEGRWEFDDRWSYISEDGRDFIRKLLVYQIDGRMDVKTALRHSWLNYADRIPAEPYKIPSENLKNYYNLYRQVEILDAKLFQWGTASFFDKTISFFTPKGCRCTQRVLIYCNNRRRK